MNDPIDDSPKQRANGRRTALIVILVAFVASATTAMLAFTASHRAQKADTAALEADVADLHAALADWEARVTAVQRAGHEQAVPLLVQLDTGMKALSAWHPRTPCGELAREPLRVAMEARARRLQRLHEGQQAGIEPIDEQASLENALRQCEREPGRDVNI
ncbi:MAG: hypothetical protein ABWX83_01000 [Luteibacter sp.]|jgi:hypothetical protein